MYNLDDFIRIYKFLTPTGRAFRINEGSNKELLVKSRYNDDIANGYLKVYKDLVGILDGLIPEPDNTNFDAWYCTRWEQVLGLGDRSGSSLVDRKRVIYESLTYPSDALYRGSAEYLQERLRIAGYQVLVTYNSFSNGSGGYEPHDPSMYMTAKEIQHGMVEHGEIEHGTSYYDVVANYADSTKDQSFVIGNLRNTFFISSDTNISTPYILDKSKEYEFRKLILRLKYSHLVALLNVNYI